MPSLPPIVVFDLDGTLAETAGDLVGTLNAILAREGLPTLPLDRARDMIGAGAKALIQRGFEAAGEPIDDARLQTLFVDFLDHYGRHLSEHSYLFPGAEAALDALSARGFLLAVCTNKVEAHAKQLLQELGVAGRFAAICGRDTFPVYKPNPAHITLTVEQAKGDVSRAVMVGDSRADIDAAKAAGIPVIAVPFGYTDLPVEQLGPTRVIQHFDELVGAVDALVPAIAAA
ncbi:phosphoglycolate phosphatase [Methylobacterium sp. Leaf93]|uniref:phosphoglycolate phosphatase n=1 Tax=Methylobacterium sp. Leaf93 TaxID=1736249 RepID=UPI0006FF0B13|nr:phosphoglycolate phosphatase [Methylobacterium sp. Leaf93]KQP06912.1 phosphoglycolate phosphatase [Methylobacterium sp. Leaf93]